MGWSSSYHSFALRPLRGAAAVACALGPATPRGDGARPCADAIDVGAPGSQTRGVSPILVLPFPVIDPVLFAFGPVIVRWYALAYIFGLILGWLYTRALVRRPALWGGRAHPTAESLDDLLVYATFGTIVGGRLFNVLFYGLDYYLARPAEILAVWNGGMAFHGGVLGVGLALWIFARRGGYPPLSVADLCSAAAPIGILFGRLANFIKPELWGRPTDVAWAMVFPGAGPLPRHPSQLYEAGLEGLLLFCVLALAIVRGGLRRPGLVSGVFGLGYAVSRIVSEMFREPDPQLEALGPFWTMGMVLSLPMAAAGLVLIVRSLRAPATAAPDRAA